MITAALCTLVVLVSSGPGRPLLQEGDERPLPALVVSGSAEVAAAPDRAVLSLGATAQAPSAATAQQQVNQAMQSAIAAIRELGVPEQDLRTTRISLQPVYSDPRATGEDPGEPRIVGYRASNAVRVELSGTSMVGAVIDAGIAAGANQLEELSFALADDSAQRVAALRRAVEDARAKAEALAEAAGVQLVAIRRVEEGGVQTLGPDVRHARLAMEAGTPVQPGEVRVNASVTLTYTIAPRADVPR